MSERTPRTPPVPSDATTAEREIERLIRTAGPRPEVPPEDLASIKAAFRAEWQAQVARPLARRRGRVATYLTLAAAVLVALGLAWFARRSVPAPARPEVVARVLGVEGPAPGEAGAWTVGQEVRAGSALATADTAGFLALRLADGNELRLDRASRVRVLSASVVELVHGAVYVESGPGLGPGRGGPEPSAIRVRTPFGEVTEVGTQFEVRLLERGDGLRVRVREGEVLVSRESAGPRTELMLDARGAVSRRTVVAHGPEWDWVLASAPALEVEGKTLVEVLAWVRRETAWEVSFEDAALAAKAAGIVVHGSLEGVRPDRVHEIVLPGAGLAFELEAGRLLVKAPN